jgi:hypothetical protein
LPCVTVGPHARATVLGPRGRDEGVEGGRAATTEEDEPAANGERDPCHTAMNGAVVLLGMPACQADPYSL